MAHAENISVLNIPPSVSGIGIKFRPPARAARLRKRHVAALISFAFCVCLPVLLAAGYLWLRAADQYASTVAFSVRSEEPSSGLEMLGGIADLSGSNASDSDILYDFLRSQQLVAEVQNELDVAAMWARPAKDWIFAYGLSGTIEDLHDHWGRMIEVSHDTTRGIIEVRARAFDAQEATQINEAILERATELINDINNIAREDAVRYALGDLQRSKTRLAQARRDMTEFRVQHQIVDPSVDMSTQSTLLATLEAQLTETLIEIEMLSANDRRSDARLKEARFRANVLTDRIAQQRTDRVLGRDAVGNTGMAALYGQYEELLVEVAFAEESHQLARVGFEAALSEARRNTRYLAAHITPTKAQQSRFPERGLILSVIALGAFLSWALLALVGFSFLDRR